MKLRFSSLDVKVIAQELNTSLVSLRIANIYDLSSRIFLFKCAKPGNKAQLLVDPGFRCHLTSFSRTAEPSPSPFVTRLRKFLKTRRITGVAQLGTDRIIEISFSDGQYRLFLEFFSAGNIILTDKELNVLALWRQVSEGDEDVDVKLGGKYILEAKQNYNGIPPLTKERVKNVLETQIQRTKAAQEAGGKKAKRQKGGDDLKKSLSAGLPEYPPILLEHVFTVSHFDTTKKPAEVLESDQLLESVMSALNQAEQIYRGYESATEVQGYIIAKEKPGADTSANGEQEKPDHKARESLLYDDFHPFKPSQFVGKDGIHVIEFNGFNQTVDDFYSSIESQKLEGRLTEREEAAKKKLEAAKNEHQKRLGALQEVQEMHVRKAQAIEANTHRVEEAIAAVNGLIGQGMDWVDIGKLIENEQKRSNPVATMIKLPLKLYENTVTLLLSEPGVSEESDDDSEMDQTDSEEESDDESAAKSKAKAAESAEKRLAIDIDLASSPWANARQYYDQKRTAAEKEQRTMQAADKALKSMEKKTEADLKKGLKQEKTGLRPARKQFWFEKFLYFISSDGYLVIGGKDATQNELLYRRYLQRGDIYVHADLNGASSVIVKNNPNTPDAPIPPSTLSQAGALTVCTSTAWDSKAVMAAWWVEAHQVSKTAPTGEYIKTGGFIIKGKKNFLPPTQLILGFGVTWQITDASRANHGKHRIPKTETGPDGEVEALTIDTQDLSIDESKDQGEVPTQDDTVPDLEDAADEAVKEVEEDEEDVSDDDDRASTIASEVEQPRSNPLQLNGRSEQETSDVENSENESDPAEEEQDEKEEHDEDGHDKSNPKNTTDSRPATSVKSESRTKAQTKRGKNTKAKRAAAAKYALQSDEERELAMDLLGSAKGQNKKEAEAIAKAAREEKAKQDKERRKQQHDKAAAAERKRMERLEKGEMGEAALNDEEQMDPEQVALERKELLDIDLLVPMPQPGDELLAAIPIVAPWSAMNRHKYKVKLQPGSVKKGKLVKEILGNWTNLATKGPKVVDETNKDKDKVWTREIELMKLWKVEEIVGVIPVKGCRVVQSGGLGAGGGAAHNGRGKGPVSRGGRGKKR